MFTLDRRCCYANSRGAVTESPSFPTPPLFWHQIVISACPSCGSVRRLVERKTPQLNASRNSKAPSEYKWLVDLWKHCECPDSRNSSADLLCRGINENQYGGQNSFAPWPHPLIGRR